MAYLASLIYGYRLVENDGSALPQRSTLNFKGTGVTATDNPSLGTTDVTITAGSSSGITDLVADVSATGPGVTTATVQGFRGRTVASTTPSDAGLYVYASPTSTWNPVVMTGDARMDRTGAVTVVGLQGYPVSTTAPTSSQVLTWSGSFWAPGAGGGGGITALTGDVTASGTGSVAATVTDITGSGGFVDVGATGAVIRWADGTTSPGITQTTSAASAGQNLTIAAQSAGGSNHDGGSLYLSGGAKTGSGFDGAVIAQGILGVAPNGSTTSTAYLTTDPAGAGLFFSTTISGGAKIQVNSPASSGAGKTFSIRGQDGATVGNNNGGDIAINAGGKTGSGTPGTIKFLRSDASTVNATIDDTAGLGTFGGPLAGGSGSSSLAAIGPRVSSPASAALYLLGNGTAPTSGNWSMLCAGSTLDINAVTGSVVLNVSGTPYLSVASSLVTVTPPMKLVNASAPSTPSGGADLYANGGHVYSINSDGDTFQLS